MLSIASGFSNSMAARTAFGAERLIVRLKSLSGTTCRATIAAEKGQHEYERHA